MKKLLTAVLAVAVLGVFASAQADVKKEDKGDKARVEFNGERRGPGGPDMDNGMREHFKARMQEHKALHEEYANAKDDKAKADAEGKIKSAVAKETDQEIAMFDKRVKKSEDNLKDAKKRLADVKKDKKDINAKKVEAIKEGKFGGPRGPKGEGKCEEGKCPFKGGDDKGAKGPKDGKGHGPKSDKSDKKDDKKDVK